MTKADKRDGIPSHKVLRKAEPEDPIRHVKSKAKGEKIPDGTEGSKRNHAGRYRPSRLVGAIRAPERMPGGDAIRNLLMTPNTMPFTAKNAISI